jgi:1-acyl-sn-glycerol-3-phosphate acyltransferase
VRFTRHGRIGPLLRFLSVVVVSLTTGFFKRDWRHLDRVPATGPAILAVNHVSYADPFLAARFVWDAGRIPRFLGKAPLFEVPVVGLILRAAGQIPVRRATDEAAHSLEAAVEALHRGQVVVIYPEGTVTRDPEFWPMIAKTGVARLALLVPEAPLIPVAQWGAQNSVDWYHRRFRLLPRKTVVTSVGRPIDTSAYVGAEQTPAALRALTDATMTAVNVELAEIRGRTAPTSFAARPPVSQRKVSKRVVLPSAGDSAPGGEQLGDAGADGGDDR